MNRRTGPLSKHNEKGVALISVLLVFAIVTIIAGEMLSRSYLDIKKSAAIINTKQAYLYALSGEQFARQILIRDYKESGARKISDAIPQSDSLTDNWSTLKKGFDINNGKLTIEILDLQGKFNLNSLRNSDGSSNREASRQFGRLLSVLKIKTNYVPVLADWLDKDKKRRINGAEDALYREKNYLTANIEIADRTELRLLRGFKPRDYDILKDHVVALPQNTISGANSKTKYNINTMDAKLLEALSSSLKSKNLKNIKTIQDGGGYNTIDQWTNSDGGPYLLPIKEYLTIESEYFEVTVKALFAERMSTIRTYFHRNAKDGTIEVIKRQLTTD